mmetsp:Transcript_14114/g.30283  ORF Transcript_14114/g.30283 Transcript_14114/m.30283 type:complete len:161 (-) Transcript_14114:561-1043(-)
MIGDSLTRQLFIALVCNAFELHNAILDHVVVPWKDSWPCVSGHACTIRGGNHSGFDAASAIFRGGTELHFVPHHGWRDRNTSEEHALERLSEEIRNTGMVTFGKKTALPPGALYDNEIDDVLDVVCRLIMLIIFFIFIRWPGGCFSLQRWSTFRRSKFSR